MSTWLSIDWDPKINERPPFLANAIARLWSETDCIIAETAGIFNCISDFSPFENLTRGTFNETLAGKQSLDVSPGIRRYSLNVLETSLKYCAITLNI